MKKNNENTTMSDVEYHAALTELVFTANQKHESLHEWLYTGLKELSVKSGITLKDVVKDFNESAAFTVSYDAVKQYTYDKKKKTAAATVKRSAYKILFDYIISKRGKLTDKQRQSCIKALQTN